MVLSSIAGRKVDASFANDEEEEAEGVTKSGSIPPES